MAATSYQANAAPVPAPAPEPQIYRDPNQAPAMYIVPDNQPIQPPMVYMNPEMIPAPGVVNDPNQQPMVLPPLGVPVAPGQVNNGPPVMDGNPIAPVNTKQV